MTLGSFMEQAEKKEKEMRYGIKPVINSILGEASPRIIDNTNDKLNRDIKVE